jgi:hypothetical protein
MGRAWRIIRSVFQSIVALLKGMIFANIGPADLSAYPRGEVEFVLNRRQLGGGSDRYAAIAGEVFRAVVEKSPRHAAAIDLRSGMIHTPDGMDLLAEHTDLQADATPDGRVVATPESVDAVARLLGPDIVSATVIDEEERPIVQWREGQALRFGLPPAAVERLSERLPDPASTAIRRTDGAR